MREWDDDSIHYIAVQETKLRHEDLPDIRSKLLRLGWTIYPGACASTDKGGRSAGVALLARNGIAVADVNRSKTIGNIHPSARWNAWLIEAGPPGGIMIISVYRRDTVGPWHPDNAKVLEQVRLAIRTVGRPYLVTGDWNAEPVDVEKCGFPASVDGSLLHDGLTTCHTKGADEKIVAKLFDFATASEGIANSMVTNLYGQFAFNPHTGVRFSLPWKIPSVMMEKIRAPKTFPRTYPEGPQMKDSVNDELTTIVNEGTSQEEMGRAMTMWYEEAEGSLAQTYSIGLEEYKYFGRGDPVRTVKAPRWQSARSIAAPTSSSARNIAARLRTYVLLKRKVTNATANQHEKYDVLRLRLLLMKTHNPPPRCPNSYHPRQPRPAVLPRRECAQFGGNWAHSRAGGRRIEAAPGAHKAHLGQQHKQAGLRPHAAFPPRRA